MKICSKLQLWEYLVLNVSVAFLQIQTAFGKCFFQCLTAPLLAVYGHIFVHIGYILEPIKCQNEILDHFWACRVSRTSLSDIHFSTFLTIVSGQPPSFQRACVSPAHIKEWTTDSRGLFFGHLCAIFGHFWVQF